MGEFCESLERSGIKCERCFDYMNICDVLLGHDEGECNKGYPDIIQITTEERMGKPTGKLVVASDVALILNNPFVNEARFATSLIAKTYGILNKARAMKGKARPLQLDKIFGELDRIDNILTDVLLEMPEDIVGEIDPKQVGEIPGCYLPEFHPHECGYNSAKSSVHMHYECKTKGVGTEARQEAKRFADSLKELRSQDFQDKVRDGLAKIDFSEARKGYMEDLQGIDAELNQVSKEIKALT